MKDNRVKRYWIFTFGCGQEHAGYYVKIYGSFMEARRKMVDRYGYKWAFQYSDKEWAKMEKNPNRLYPLEKEFEVIDDDLN